MLSASLVIAIAPTSWGCMARTLITDGGHWFMTALQVLALAVANEQLTLLVERPSSFWRL